MSSGYGDVYNGGVIEMVKMKNNNIYINPKVYKDKNTRKHRGITIK